MSLKWGRPLQINVLKIRTSRRPYNKDIWVSLNYGHLDVLNLSTLERSKKADRFYKVKTKDPRPKWSILQNHVDKKIAKRRNYKALVLWVLKNEPSYLSMIQVSKRNHLHSHDLSSICQDFCTFLKNSLNWRNFLPILKNFPSKWYMAAKPISLPPYNWFDGKFEFAKEISS